MIPPEAVNLGLFVIEEAIKAEPEIANEIRALFNKNDPSEADWAGLRNRIATKSYKDYVPDSQLPPSP